jgi:hypothetical protein
VKGCSWLPNLAQPVFAFPEVGLSAVLPGAQPGIRLRVHNSNNFELRVQNCTGQIESRTDNYPLTLEPVSRPLVPQAESELTLLLRPGSPADWQASTFRVTGEIEAATLVGTMSWPFALSGPVNPPPPKRP